MRLRPALFAVLLVFLPSPLQAQETARKQYTTAFADDPPVIDGRIDDAVWDTVEWAGDFIQWEPEAGQEPAQDTVFKILWDHDSLYFAARAFHDDPRQIENQLARRDRFPGDWIEINIDSYFDHRTAFSFTCSVSGTRGDEFISDDGNRWDGSWDPVWELRTQIDDDGWTLEARIPMSQLRFGNRDEHVWGIQVTRRHYREQQRSIWQPKLREEQGWVSRFGELHGIGNLGSPRRVELLPYGLTRGERFEEVPGDPFLDGSKGAFSLGMDGKVGVTSDLTLDFTVNPDFGQVEADPSEVNLTAFESFFSERRPFFVEGGNILNFRIAPSIAGGSFTADNLFYSRRIGRRPRYRPDLEDGEYADTPENTSILGALKLTGKTKGGLSVGILESVTARESATVATGSGERNVNVEPATNFVAARAQQDFDQGNTRLGAMFTAVNRNISDDHLGFLRDAAYAGGLDFFHHWNDKSWYVALNAAGSHVRGSAEAIDRTQRSSARYYQRPDNDHTDYDPDRTALSGHAGSARLARTGGKHFRFETGAAWRSPGFEINDLGFMRRADEINQFTWAGYRIEEPFGPFRAWRLNTNQWTTYDFGGTNLTRMFNVNSNMHFKTNDRLGLGFTRELESVSNTRLRGGPSSRWPGTFEGNFWFNSDDSHRVDYGIGGWFNNGDEGSLSNRGVWTYLGLRPSNTIRVSLNPEFWVTRPDMQYVGTEEFGDQSRYLFGGMDQQTFNLTFRLDYSITPNLTLQYYGSPFLSSASFDGFRRITNARADRYEDRYEEFDAQQIAYNEAEGTYEIDEDRDGTVDYELGDPDFDFAAFNSNLVMRWEFQPGSTLFLVWSQARDTFSSDGRFALGPDMGTLFDDHPHNVFLVKINKWLTF